MVSHITSNPRDRGIRCVLKQNRKCPGFGITSQRTKRLFNRKTFTQESRKMNRPMSELVRVALGVALTGSCSLYAIRLMTQYRISESVSYKEAMECLRSNKNLVDLLGEPIKEKRVDVSDKNCYGHDDHSMWVSVPLKGDKSSGNLRYWVTVDDRGANKFRVTKILFEPNETTGQTLTLKEDPSPES